MYRNLISTLNRHQIAYTLYLGCTCSLLTGVAHPLAATWSSQVLELIMNEKQRTDIDGEINRLCISFILYGIAVMVVSSLGRASWLLVSESWTQGVRLLFLEHTLSSLSKRSNSDATGIELINNIAGIGTTGALCLSSLLHTASSCVTSIVVCFIHSAKLTLVILSLIPLMVMVTVGFARMARSSEQQRWTSFLYLNSLTLNAVSHATTLRQLAIHDNYLTLFKRAQEAFVKFHNRWCHFPAARTGVVELLSCGIFMIGLWYGALLVAGPESLVAIQDVIVVLYNCLFLLFSLQRVQPVLTWFELNSSQLSRLDQMCSPACQTALCQHSSPGSNISTPNSSESREQSDNHIELQNVSFVYGQHSPVLRNLNLVIPRGKITLIHGAVGSGKSTLLKLMNGELSPLQGKMLMDGSDMDHTLLATSCLSSRGIVDFDPLFFEETVFRNISFGRHDFWNVTLNQVIHVCRLVGLHDTINQWPLKYATVLYRNASSLSSSQRKQMAIARALIQDPDILFMDEPTSSVDEALNRMLFKTIGLVRAGKTTVIISHRLDVVVDIADKVIDMAILMDPASKTPSTKSSTDTKEVIVGMALPDDNILYERPLIKRRTIRQSLLSMMKVMHSDTVLLDGLDNNEGRYQQYICDNLNVYYYHHQNHRQANIVAAPSDIAIAFPSPTATNSRRITSAGAAIETQDDTTAAPRFDSLPSQSCHLASDSRSSLQVIGPEANQRFWWISYAWKHKRLYESVLVLYVLCLGQGILVPFYSSALSKLLASYSQLLDHDTVTFQRSLVPVIGFSAAKALLSWLTQWYQRTSGKRCVTQLQYDMMQQLVAPTSSLAALNHAFSSSMGSLSKTQTATHSDDNSLVWWHLQLVQKYPSALDWLLTRCISQNLIAICVLLASTVTSLCECWKLTLVALSVSLSILAAAAVIKKSGSSKYHLPYKKSQNEGDKLIDEIAHTRSTIRMLGLQSYFIRNAQLSLQLSLGMAKRGIPYTAISYGLVEGIIYFTKATLFWYGTQLVRWREFDSHSIVVVWLLMIFMGSCHGQVMSTVSSWSQMKDQFAAMKTGLARGRSSSLHRSRENELYVNGGVGGMTSSPKTIKSVCAAELFKVSLQFDNIKVLSDVSIRIPNGKWIGLMGKSGSGKTMVLQALLYTHGRHQNGQIFVGGQPIVTTMLSRQEQERRIVNWRQKFGMVDQDPRFFPISIHDNVALGSVSFDPSRAQVQHACQLANIHDHIISLPDGYDTLLDKGGTSFSSGQQRLLALARALIREPKLLLLDDITSALDNTGLRLVHRTLKQLVANGASILMVSHNSLMLESTDQVYEMDQGRMVKKGQYGYL